MKLKVIDVDNKIDINFFSKFYKNIYEKNFFGDEKDDFCHFVRCLKMSKHSSEFRHLIILAMINQKVIAGIIGDYFVNINSGIIEYIVVDEKYREHGIAKLLLSKFIQILNCKAKHFCKKSKCEYLFLEMEDPNKVNDEGILFANKRLMFWRNQNFKNLDINYVQPALSCEKKPDTNLLLNVNTFDCRNEISSNIVKTLIVDYVKYTFFVKKPYANNEVKKNISLIKSDYVKLQDLKIYLKNA